MYNTALLHLQCSPRCNFKKSGVGRGERRQRNDYPNRIF